MADDRIERILRRKLRSAGRQVGEARRAYRRAKRATRADLPSDEEGKARIVCRRYAQRRAVVVDAAGRPECFDPASTDCRGCVEDIREGTVETW